MMTETTSAQEGDVLGKETVREIVTLLEEENKRLRKDNWKMNDKIRRIESGCFDEFYTFSTLEVELPPKGSATTTITLGREADFYVTKMVRTGRSFKFLVRDTGNDRKWSNIHLDCKVGAGTAMLPLILPKPRFVARTATIEVELLNKLNIPNPVSLAFIGYKVYHVENLVHATG
jgi:hypothetical protein